MKRNIRIKVSGKVQGVWFRRDTQLEAQKLGVTGFVRNEPDGSVFIEAEADIEILKAFETWCKSGSELARVDNVDVSEGEMANYTSFEVLAEKSDYLS